MAGDHDLQSATVLASSDTVPLCFRAIATRRQAGCEFAACGYLCTYDDYLMKSGTDRSLDGGCNRKEY